MESRVLHLFLCVLVVLFGVTLAQYPNDFHPVYNPRVRPMIQNRYCDSSDIDCLLSNMKVPSMSTQITRHVPIISPCEPYDIPCLENERRKQYEMRPWLASSRHIVPNCEPGDFQCMDRDNMYENLSLKSRSHSRLFDDSNIKPNLYIAPPKRQTFPLLKRESIPMRRVAGHLQPVCDLNDPKCIQHIRDMKEAVDKYNAEVEASFNCAPNDMKCWDYEGKAKRMKAMIENFFS